MTSNDKRRIQPCQKLDGSQGISAQNCEAVKARGSVMSPDTTSWLRRWYKDTLVVVDVVVSKEKVG